MKFLKALAKVELSLTAYIRLENVANCRATKERSFWQEICLSHWFGSRKPRNYALLRGEDTEFLRHIAEINRSYPAV